jgi:hypothetical protein
MLNEASAVTTVVRVGSLSVPDVIHFAVSEYCTSSALNYIYLSNTAQPYQCTMHKALALARKQRNKEMSVPSDEWVTQEQVAQELGVPVERVRPVVSALSGIKQIKTTRNVRDRRYVLVHRDSIPVIRQAIYNVE